MELFGQSMILPEFPVNKNIYGLGMSDREEYAELLTKKFSYTNTYYHQQPEFDITCVDAKLYKKFDFVISCDVLEHVKPPTIIAFNNLRKILKDDGLLILTIPYMLFENTWEHFPELNKFKIVEDGMEKKLVNITIHGEQQEFTNLSFHGGQGATLELRVFTKSSIKQELKKSGFREIEFSKCYEPTFGISEPINWSLPIMAKA
jgi:SAM-dependent methyltransferase